jgi:predicted RNA-binding protein YlxR (DUF448 family)
MCAGCGEHKPKKELVRVVRSPQGEISLDLVGKKPGRAAYVCRNPESLKKARKSKTIDKTLGCQITDEVWGQMEEEMAKGG